MAYFDEVAARRDAQILNLSFETEREFTTWMRNIWAGGRRRR